MELKIFGFIDDVTECLEKWNKDLLIASGEISSYFKDILKDNGDGYLNIVSRVKSPSSLKEKILRNNYYKKYSDGFTLLNNLQDLIGTRLECRFINDEEGLYQIIKKFFYRKTEDGYYFNSVNKNILLKLEGAQPQMQKNGFEIYRIDGLYINGDKRYNFELQIKSLVNVFWGEIEHKIIYKNYNYMLGDQFMKEIMGAIKKNLTMIDNQLLLIYNQVNKADNIDLETRKRQVESLLSKGVYDIFALRMKKNIGFIVDFKKSCETVINYIFRSNLANHLSEYNEMLIKTLSRLNEISDHELDFSKEIEFERELVFEDEFSEIFGNALLKSLNIDFQWNLFFKMLFHIEPGNNAEDFEGFIKFLKNELTNKNAFKMLENTFECEQYVQIKNEILVEIAKAYSEVDSIEFIYSDNILNINECTLNFIDTIVNNIKDYETYEGLKGLFLKLYRMNIVSIFGDYCDGETIRNLSCEINEAEINSKVKRDLIYYLDRVKLLQKVEDNKSYKQLT